MSATRTRVIAALVMAPFAIGAILLLPTSWLVMLAALVFLVGLWEWFKLAEIDDTLQRTVLPAVLCVWLFLKRDILEEPGRCLTLAVSLLLLPAAVSSIYLINAEGQSVFMHVVMTYSCVLSPVFALRLAELSAADGNAGRASFWCACCAARY